MAQSGGYAGNILYIDLTENSIRKEPLNLDIAKDYIGGLGLNTKLAYDLIKPGTDPLSPENVIVIGTGPLSGTLAPGNGRIFAASKLPNNTIGWAGSGGMSFGCMFKASGYDHIVVKGKAAKPVYLKIFDDDVEICDAKALWGKGVDETTDDLWKEFDRPLGVITIGPSGENLVSFAMSFVDKAGSLGRGGLGAVMGAKNLKAIIVKGTKGVKVSDQKRFRDIYNSLFDRMRKWAPLKKWQELGYVLYSEPMGILSSEFYLEKMKKERIGCISCTGADKDVVQIKEGRFKGFTACTTSAPNLLFPQTVWGLPYDESIKFAAMLDDYGLDVYEFLSLIDFSNKLYSNGIISSDYMDSKIERTFDSLTEWVGKITYRKGFGDILANGLQGVIDKFGEDTKALAPPMTKGLTTYQNPKGPIVWDRLGTSEFGFIVGMRGPHLAAGSSPTYYAKGRPLEEFVTHLDRTGVPDSAVKRILPPPDEWSWGLDAGIVTSDEKMGLNVGRLTRYGEDWFTAFASMGICGKTQVLRFYTAELLAELYSAATGIEISKEELMKSAERAWNLLKVANVKEGFGRDEMPNRWFEKPMFLDYSHGKVEITEEIMSKFVDDYYDERGWNKETGVPTKQKLLELGLNDVAQELERLGKL